MSTHTTPTNPYEGVLPLWAYELTVAYAKRLGYRQDQIDDGLQDVAIAFASYRFDGARNTGASERTAQIALIRHVLQKTLRREIRHAQRIDRLRAEPPRREAGPDTIAQHELWQAIEAMPDPDRQICLLLADGKSTDAIAKELQLGWHTVKAAMQRIRAQFTEAGIDGGLLG